jgi:hypothetical protein
MVGLCHVFGKWNNHTQRIYHTKESGGSQAFQIVVVCRFFRSLNSTIMKRHKEHILRTGRNELVHHNRALLLLHHRTDSTPAVVLDRADCRCPSAGGDWEAFREQVAVDVVLWASSAPRTLKQKGRSRVEKCRRRTYLTHDVFITRHIARDSRRDLRDERFERGVFDVVDRMSTAEVCNNVDNG